MTPKIRPEFHQPKLPKAVHLPEEDKFAFHHVGAATVTNVVRTMRNTPAVGPDNVPVGVLKAAIPVIALPLAKICNRIIDDGIWPTTWSIATVVPLLKSGKAKEVFSSYRPVALLAAVSKVIERVLYNQLADFAEEKGLLPRQQHGFRRNRGIDTALANLSNAASLSKDSKKTTIGASFDFSAAFDTIDVDFVVEILGAWMAGKPLSLS